MAGVKRSMPTARTPCRARLSSAALPIAPSPITATSNAAIRANPIERGNASV